MSGGNCPETPRQKMIGMMYLFLTAMLALNVSGDLLNAFILVDQSIMQAKESVEKKNNILYLDFDAAKAANEAKVSENFQKAQEVKSQAESLVKHIQDLKILFVQTAGGPEATPTNYETKDNQDITGQLMITEQQGGRSTELKKMITDYKELLLSYVEVDTTLRSSINKTLSTDDPPSTDNVKKSWESQKFEYLPMAASIAMLSQLQSAIRNMESDVVRHLYTRLDAGAFKFNKVDPLVIPRSTYVISGDTYYAEIMMAARDTTQDPIVTVRGKQLETTDGRGILSIPATSTGNQKWEGEISVKGPDGEPRRYKISGEYLVSKPSVVISPVKMNVFYEGVENPVEISVPGIPSENLKVNISNARSVQKGNQYIVSPNAGSSGSESVISVVAKINGRDQSLGRQIFRIKRVPDPVAKIGGLREGKMNKALLLAQLGVVAEMENFDFDLTWRVSRFTLSTTRGGYQVDESSDNNLLTKAQKELIQGIARGQKVYFENIRAEGPGGTIRSLGSITITVD
jgi:gliding motility-associated protein GldM